MATTTGPGSLSAQASVLQAKENHLIQQSRSLNSSSDDAKIDKGAQQFEAILMDTWLKEAEQSFGSVPGGDDDQDAGGSQMMSLGVQSLATSLAASGGIGIGKMIAKAMHAKVDKPNMQNAGTANPPSAASIDHHEK
jgi:Rod binding domain-containing protein